MQNFCECAIITQEWSSDICKKKNPFAEFSCFTVIWTLVCDFFVQWIDTYTCKSKQFLPWFSQRLFISKSWVHSDALETHSSFPPWSYFCWFLAGFQVSIIGILFLMGLYISSISSCMGGLYGSPRILQTISNDEVIPIIRILGQGVSMKKNLSCYISNATWESLTVHAPLQHKVGHLVKAAPFKTSLVGMSYLNFLDYPLQ